MGLHGQGLHGGHFLDALGYIIFFFISFRRIDIDGPLKIGRTELAHFDSFLQDVVQAQGVGLEDECRPADEFCIGDTSVDIAMSRIREGIRKG